VRVDLCRRQVGVTKKFLQRSQRTPEAASRVAKVWRESWNRMTGTPTKRRGLETPCHLGAIHRRPTALGMHMNVLPRTT
jgi:hypothetical protein